MQPFSRSFEEDSFTQEYKILHKKISLCGSPR